MTERLYYDDAYLTQFEARIVDRADGGRRVYLDRTALYPTSGGQPHDTGMLDGVRVEDVVDEDGRIAHVLAAPVAAGEIVHGTVDWERRHDHMQQHTGQHLLSALFADRLGLSTVSVHFGPVTSTLDLEGGPPTDEALASVESVANDVVLEDRPVTVGYEAAADAAGLRKAVARSGPLRIVSIDGIDRSACGGTHVRRTGEIGPVSIRGREHIRRATRVGFVCGGRALRRMRDDRDALARIARLLSAAPDEAPALVEGLREQLRAAQARLRQLAGEHDTLRAQVRHATQPPGADGLRWVVERRDAGAVDEWRPFAQAYCALPRAVFVGVSGEPPTVLVATSPDSGIDAGQRLRGLLGPLGGRGGGSARLAQGTVPSTAQLEALLAGLRGG
jgi:alanyl-tRNA synthetase